LRAYRLPPIIVPHYGIIPAIGQKIGALATRAVTQARDVFDLFQLSTQYRSEDGKVTGIGAN
ncbi:hypothetical protein IBX73_11435, partial [candidate division WOR-3 bacterium]|nr:hypothetical protein [candidate division WOR-3 bacterium]